jgi:hypothetical protein
MECYVGLDVHSKASVFVMQDAHGEVLAQGEMPTTPEGFRRWHDAQRLPAGTPVALETGTVAFFVARELTVLGCAPLVVDAREVRLKAHRPTQKSDRRDAFELCDGLRRGIYRAIVHVPPRPVARDAGAPSARRAPRDRAGERGQTAAARRGAGPLQPESRNGGRMGEAARHRGRAQRVAGLHRAAPRPLALCAGAAGGAGERVECAAGCARLRASPPPAPDHPRRRPDRRRHRPGRVLGCPPVRGREARGELCGACARHLVEQVTRKRAPAIMRREGYDPSALGEVVEAVVDRLCGEPPGQHVPRGVEHGAFPVALLTRRRRVTSAAVSLSPAVALAALRGAPERAPDVSNGTRDTLHAGLPTLDRGRYRLAARRARNTTLFCADGTCADGTCAHGEILKALVLGLLGVARHRGRLVASPARHRCASLRVTQVGTHDGDRRSCPNPCPPVRAMPQAG